MTYCTKCKKEVNVSKNTVNIGIADVWQEHCEECNEFIASGIDEVKDIVFDFTDGIDNCKVSTKDSKE